jgi:glycosyltransferase involved in cell wall biosynthesis
VLDSSATSSCSVVGKRQRLGILTTHPIQYYSPWFVHLASQVDLTVYYVHMQTQEDNAKSDFGVAFEWDRDLLSGYDYRWLNNVGSHRKKISFLRFDTPELSEIIRRGKFDAFLVLGWSYRSAWQAFNACQRYRVPVFMRGDSHGRRPEIWWKKLVKRLTYPRLLPKFDAHLYVGARNRDYLLGYGVAEDRLYFSPHFVDAGYFHNASTIAAAKGGGRDAVRSRLGIPDNAFVFTFVGALIPRKCPEVFISAIRRYLEQCNSSNVFAVVIGEGALRSTLEESSRDLHENVRFAGFVNQSEMPAYYSCADVIVVPSAYESWGLVVNEAAACGVPAIVSSNVGCSPDLVDEKFTGFSFPPGDSDKLLAAMCRAMDLCTQEQDLMQAALAQKSKEYSVLRATQGLFDAMSRSNRKDIVLDAGTVR